MSEATLTAPAETRTDTTADAAVETPEVVEDPVIESGDAYLESLNKQGKPEESAPESKPFYRPGLDKDPRAGQYIQEFRQAHETRQHEIDAIADELIRDYGVPEAMARRIVKEQKDRLNSHHADALRLSGYDAASTAVQYEQSHISDAIASALPKALHPKLAAKMEAEIQTNGVASYTTVMKTIVELAREGFVPDKDHKEALKDAFNEGRKQGLRGASTVDKSNTAAGRVQSTPVGTSKAPKSLAEAQAQHVAGAITNEQMRQYKTQFS